MEACFHLVVLAYTDFLWALMGARGTVLIVERSASTVISLSLGKDGLRFSFFFLFGECRIVQSLFGDSRLTVIFCGEYWWYL